MRSLWRSALLFLACAAPLYAADEIPPSPIVKTALVVDAADIKKDSASWVGVKFTMPEHWHIYWQNPGDSGIPTTLTFTTPQGITAGDIVWPTPERLETSGLLNYGYSNEVTLPVPLTASRDNVKGKLTVNAKWLVCRDVCIPESAVLTAALPSHSEQAGPVLEQALMHAPQVAPSLAASYRITGEKVILTVSGVSTTPVTSAVFLPLDDGIVTNPDPQQFVQEGNALTLTMKRGSEDPAKLWHGVLQLQRDGATENDTILARLTSVEAAPPMPQHTQIPLSFVLALGLAFLGGLILNVMPCVLPILALKALALVKKSQASRAAAIKQGLAYTLGVIASFLIIAGIMLALKASGAAIGWGFQLQNPIFVGVLFVIMLLVAANLLGLFTLPVLFGTQAMAVEEGTFIGSLLTGALAVLVATPCTAPFMATALGATLAFPALQALLVFAFLGLGMASPFLLISVWPAARRLLPKPGAWMHRLKQFLALPMLATAIWLLFVLVQLLHPKPMVEDAAHQPYSAASLEQLRRDGKPVLVDATAAWCLSCKVNERVALRPEAMQQFFREHQVTLMVADWTTNSPEITDYLSQFGRNGVPLYVYYPPHKAPIVLPQILTPSLVRDAILNEHE